MEESTVSAPVKVPKPRKPMTQETRDKLAQARIKANEIRKQNQANRLDKKLERINNEIEETEKAKLPNEDTLPLPDIDPDTDIDPDPGSPRPSSPVRDPKPEITTKTKKKKNTKIIVEQSSDDSDEFETNDKVIFVKRVSRKKKELPPPPSSPVNTEPVRESTYQPASKMYQPPSSVAPPPRPIKSHQEKMYDNMFSGGFLKRF